MKEEQETQAVAIPLPRMADLSPEYAEIMVLGNVLQKSGYFKDVRDQAQAVTKILFGRELGFSPIVSMGGIHIIEGKPALSSNLMATLIKRSGKYDYRVKVWTHTECILTFRENVAHRDHDKRWEDVGESSFTMEDAKAAKVVRAGGSWDKFPKAMLFARALSQGLRTYCPDVSAAPIYNPEEMGATVGEDGDVIELPKSAQPKGNVERTTSEIPINGPAKHAAADRQPTVKGEAVPEEAVDGKAEGGPAAIVEDSAPQQSSAEFIDRGRQVALHRAFKDAIRNPEAKKHAEAYFRDWLVAQKFIGPDGNGSTKVVPVSRFDEVRNEAVKFAAAMPE